MIYKFTHRDGSSYASALAGDLSARKAAEQTTDIERVETIDGRVVWRRVPEISGLQDGGILTWLDRKK